MKARRRGTQHLLPERGSGCCIQAVKPDGRCTNERKVPLRKAHDVATLRVECTRAPETPETPEEAYACRMASTTQRDNRNLDRALPRIQEWKMTNSWSVLLIGPIRLTYATKAHTGQPGAEPPPGPSPECELSVAQQGQVEFRQGLRQEHRIGPEDHRFPIQQLPAAIPTEHGVHKRLFSYPVT